MNRLIRPVLATRQVLQRRSLISSLETGGHAHAKEGYALFTKHPAWYRYLGILVCAQAPILTWVFFVDANSNRASSLALLMTSLSCATSTLQSFRSPTAGSPFSLEELSSSTTSTSGTKFSRL